MEAALTFLITFAYSGDIRVASLKKVSLFLKCISSLERSLHLIVWQSDQFRNVGIFN